MNQKQFYKTVAWRRTRASYIAYRKAMDGGLCEACGQDLGKIVHHKIWLNDNNCNDPEISLAHSNLMYECQTCHNKERDLNKSAPGRVVFDKDGNIISVRDY